MMSAREFPPVFVIFGDKHRTEPAPGGLRVTRACPKCKQVTTFRERVVSKRFRLYFVEMFTHGTHHVLECSECGTAFVTDEVKGTKAVNDHSGTVLGGLHGALATGKQVMEGGKQALEDGRVSEALQQAESIVDTAMSTAQKKVGGLVAGLLSRDGKSRD